jgi:dephospho-CoA kinase
VIVFGLTGGIGSGKSTVSALLAERGASIVDADRIYRELTGPGGAVLDALAERFGPEVIAADGSLDRPVLAAKVFTDSTALAELNAITHPVIGARMAARLAELASTDDVVVLDVPLMTESGTLAGGMSSAGIIVVDADEDKAVERLVGQRGMSDVDARARIAAQAGRDERKAKADFVVDNSGDRNQLKSEVDRLWTWMQRRAAEIRTRTS